MPLGWVVLSRTSAPNSSTASSWALSIGTPPALRLGPSDAVRHPIVQRAKRRPEVMNLDARCGARYCPGVGVGGFDVQVKLRRGIGGGKPVPEEELIERLKPFDKDNDGAIDRAELAEFFKKHRVGGPWLCNMLAGSIWKIAEISYVEKVAWIKIEGVAKLIHMFMSQPPRRPKRVRITPEGAQGYEPLETLEDFRARRRRGDYGPPPRRKKKKKKKVRRSGGSSS